MNLQELAKIKEALLPVSSGYYERLRVAGKACLGNAEFAKFLSEPSLESLAKIVSRLAVLAQTKVYLSWKASS